MTDIETIPNYGNNGFTFRKTSTGTTRTVCQCCPYGYHIDLGFVEFCDRLSKENKEATPSQTERRQRRRQRQSMDVLLGISNPLFWNVQQLLPSVDRKVTAKETFVRESPPPVPPRNSSLENDHEGLRKAFHEFENLLEHASIQYNSKAPHAPGGRLYTPEKPGCSKDPDVYVDMPKHWNEEKRKKDAQKALKKIPLKDIRDQMATSLERIRVMEEELKKIPLLQENIRTLERENRELTAKTISLCERNKMMKRDLDCASDSNRVYRQKLDVSNQINEMLDKEVSKIKVELRKRPICREVSVQAVIKPKTREVGTGVSVAQKNIATEMPVIFTKEKGSMTDSTPVVVGEVRKLSLKDLQDEVVVHSKTTPEEPDVKNASAQSEKTTVKDIGVGTPQTEKKDAAVETKKAYKRDASVSAIPVSIDAQVHVKPSTKNCGSSDDSVDRIQCGHDVAKKSVGVGNGNVKDAGAPGMTSRKKSYDLTKLTRSIGVSTIPPVKKLTATKQVGTVEVAIQKKNIGVNTLATAKRDATVSADVKMDCEKCKKQEANESKAEAERALKDSAIEVESKREATKGEPAVKTESASHCTSSKIPRPTGSRTPVLNRKKFIRQDTYSKSSPMTSSLDGYLPKLTTPLECPEDPKEEVKVTLRKKVPKTEESAIADVEKRLTTDLTLAEKRESTSSSVAGRFSAYLDDYDYDEQYGDSESNRNSHIFPDSALFQPIQDKSREKLVPSKEMKAAMKVVNDGLHKHPKGLPKFLATASGIIQHEWFTISSTATANPLDVEDYLDSFEETSNTLLEYVVNIVDNNGNTAMHYAVSHGNFDVVSILLDSKVCNINKANAAGYTCVMLVSLAQVRSDTHREVVRRLFLLADVNVRAKQHGQTALMLAVSHGRLDMVELLLEAGADPNIQDVDGSTALMCAAEHGHLEIVKQILAHPECDPSIVDCDGSSALAIAMEAGNRDIGVLLYAREHFAPNSRGSSPYTSIKQRRSRPSSSRTPTSPGPKKSDLS